MNLVNAISNVIVKISPSLNTVARKDGHMISATLDTGGSRPVSDHDSFHTLGCPVYLAFCVRLPGHFRLMRAGSSKTAHVRSLEKLHTLFRFGLNFQISRL